MRERGVQSRRVKPGRVGPVQRPGPPPPSGPNAWQVLAIVAIIAATAGWTTAAVIAFRDPSAAATEEPFDSLEPEGSVAIDEPATVAHDAPDLEALLPRSVNGTELIAESIKGEDYLADDTWSTSVRAFLTKSAKTVADFRLADAYDPNGALPGTVFVYRVSGVAPAALRDALIAAWKGDSPNMTVTQVKIGGKDVSKAAFAGADTSYLYVRDDVVFDIETSDDCFAMAVFAALPEPGASGAPASQATGSALPQPSGSGGPASGPPGSAAGSTPPCPQPSPS